MSALQSIVLRPDATIGNVGAETDDEFLFKCFVDHPALAEIRDMSNSKMFLLGSTGIGKTAMLRMLDKNEDSAQWLDLSEMALNYVANSDAVAFMIGLGVDLSIFFQALWKHVILVEFAKSALKIDRQESRTSLISRLFGGNLRNDSFRRELEDFIDKYHGDFWNTVDQTVIDVTKKLEHDVQAEFGAELSKVQGKASYARNLSEEKRTQFQERAKRFVNSDLLSKLGRVTTAIAELTKGSGKRHYLLIDRLDDHWIDYRLKNILVYTLFEACKGLRKIRNLKVVVAMRNDVYEKMNVDFPPSAVQVEKNEDFIVRIRWTKDQLWSLVERRINHLFKQKYTKSDVHFYDIFKETYDNKQKAWPYILERTLSRPRDAIKFVNFALHTAESRSEVSKANFGTAEQLYSDDRLKALVYEWQPLYPSVSVLLQFLFGKQPNFLISEICTTKFIELMFDRLGVLEETHTDTVWKLIEGHVNSSRALEPIDLAREVFYRLHMIGAVGLKLTQERPWNWTHETLRPVNSAAISIDTRVAIHPMLWLALENVTRKPHRT
jgi:hypothetical protein